jgi:hypothetical protein
VGMSAQILFDVVTVFHSNSKFSVRAKIVDSSGRPDSPALAYALPPALVNFSFASIPIASDKKGVQYAVRICHEM